MNLYALPVTYPDGTREVINLTRSGTPVFPTMRKIDARAMAVWTGEESNQTLLIDQLRRDRIGTLMLLFATALLPPAPGCTFRVRRGFQSYPGLAIEGGNGATGRYATIKIPQMGWFSSLYQPRLAVVAAADLGAPWLMLNCGRPRKYIAHKGMHHHVSDTRHWLKLGGTLDAYGLRRTTRDGRAMLEHGRLDLAWDEASETPTATVHRDEWRGNRPLDAEPWYTGDDGEPETGKKLAIQTY